MDKTRFCIGARVLKPLPQDPKFLSHFVGITGNILPGTVTGFNSQNQRRLARAISRARMLCKSSVQLVDTYNHYILC